MIWILIMKLTLLPAGKKTLADSMGVFETQQLCESKREFFETYGSNLYLDKSQKPDRIWKMTYYCKKQEMK